jgi:hypothetical protein
MRTFRSGRADIRGQEGRASLPTLGTSAVAPAAAGSPHQAMVRVRPGIVLAGACSPGGCTPQLRLDGSFEASDEPMVRGCAEAERGAPGPRVRVGRGAECADLRQQDDEQKAGRGFAAFCRIPGGVGVPSYTPWSEPSFRTVIRLVRGTIYRLFPPGVYLVAWPSSPQYARWFAMCSLPRECYLTSGSAEAPFPVAE